MGEARGGADRGSSDGGHLFIASLTFAKIPSCDCGPSEQGFVVDAFNTQILSPAQSGCALSSSERDLQMQSTSKEKSNVER
jgi:hypothetical protein